MAKYLIRFLLLSIVIFMHFPRLNYNHIQRAHINIITGEWRSDYVQRYFYKQCLDVKKKNSNKRSQVSQQND